MEKLNWFMKGEQEGANEVSFHLISMSIKTLFPKYFPKIEKLEKPNEVSPYDEILEWFSMIMSFLLRMI